MEIPIEYRRAFIETGVSPEEQEARDRQADNINRWTISRLPTETIQKALSRFKNTSSDFYFILSGELESRK